jgi:hypothetical protein
MSRLLVEPFSLNEMRVSTSESSRHEMEATGFVRLASPSGQSPLGVGDTYALVNCTTAIEDVVLSDDRRVQAFLKDEPPAGEIARLAGEGIRREGLRRLAGDFEGEQGILLCDELVQCDSIESILRLCAVFYTRDTFLYRHVNQYLRFNTESDRETGRNLGLYIGLLRECFSVTSGTSPLPRESPTMVYRGANLSIDSVVDYARHPDELIRWQGFTSTSRDRRVALGFPGSVLFEISLVDSLPSLDRISAFTSEQELVLTPYKLFELSSVSGSWVHWDADCGRWIVSLDEMQNMEPVRSWIGRRAA